MLNTDYQQERALREQNDRYFLENWQDNLPEAKDYLRKQIEETRATVKKLKKTIFYCEDIDSNYCPF